MFTAVNYIKEVNALKAYVHIRRWKVSLEKAFCNWWSHEDV
jgi:hypothetical protein